MDVMYVSVGLDDVIVGDQVELSERYEEVFHQVRGVGWLTVERVMTKQHDRLDGGRGFSVSFGGRQHDINASWFKKAGRRPVPIFRQEYLGMPTEPTHAEIVARELYEDFVQMTERYDADHPLLSDQSRHALKVRRILREVAVANNAEREFLNEFGASRRRPGRPEAIIPDYEYKYLKYKPS